MGSKLGDWPSFHPQNFTQLRPSDPSNPFNSTPAAATYCPTHNRTFPPPDQVITTDPENILLRKLYSHADEKSRPKRAASEDLIAEQVCKKQPRASPS